MARTKISEFSATAADNTDIDSIDIAEGCAPSGINNAIRELMAQLKDFQTGAGGDPFNGAVNGTLGATTPAAAAVTTLSYTGTLTGGTGVVNIGSGQFYKDASGNLGIGTASPVFKLDVRAASESVLNLYNTTTTSNDTSEVQVSSFGGAYWDIISHNASSYKWKTYNAERMRLDSSGNLLVGTTVLAPTTTAGTIIRANGVGQFTANSTQALDVIRIGTAGAMVAFNYGSTNVGTITTSGTSVAYNTTSDYRLKENVSPMTGALATVAQLKPCTYRWKADGSAGQGFIAHELQSVVPDCVTGEKDAVDKDGKPQYQGVDTSFLVATLVAALQEQQALIQDLTTRLTALEGN